MYYKFICPKCKKEYDINIRVTDYDKEKNNQFCEDDNTKLERIIEFDGAIGATGGYDTVAGKTSWQRG